MISLVETGLMNALLAAGLALPVLFLVVFGSVQPWSMPFGFWCSSSWFLHLSIMCL